MTDDFCRAVRNAMPDIAQSVVTAMEDDLADCRARLAEVEAERDRLRAKTDYCPHCDCRFCRETRDEWRDRWASAHLAQTKEPEHDDDT